MIVTFCYINKKNVIHKDKYETSVFYFFFKEKIFYARSKIFEIVN